VSTWTREVAREGIAARGDVVVSRAVPVIGDVAELEGGIQAFYLGMLLTILGGAGFIVVRQVLIRRELDDQAKKMGERIRAGNASAEDYFEMGSILLRKKVFTQAVRNLQAAEANWDGDEQDLALVHNALGFGYSNTDKIDDAIVEYKKSVALQPGYVTAWNNLGEAYEKKKELKEAIKCYEESLVLAPNNPTATERLEEIKMRLRRRGQLEE
jgi:tetratricopeptide (TPR) repeat protein